MLNKQSDLSNPTKGDHCMTDRTHHGKVFGVPRNIHFDQGILQASNLKQEGLNTTRNSILGQRGLSTEINAVMVTDE